jgi:hypothetical protein
MEIVPCRKCIGYRLAKSLTKFLKRRWPYGGEIERDYVEQEIVEELTRAGWQVKRLTGFGRTLGVGFLLSVITNPYSYRKALSKHPTLEKILTSLFKTLSRLLDSYDNLVVVGVERLEVHLYN